MVQEALYKNRGWLPQDKGRWCRCGAFRSFIGRGRSCSGMFRLRHGGSVKQAHTPVCIHPHQPGIDDPAKQPYLPSAAVFGGEVGGAMLAITGATRLWYVSSVTNMRFGKYRLFSEVQAQGMDAYNSDAYLFMSRNHRTVKIILYKNHKRHLYDVTFDDDYKFMRPIIEGDEIIYELQFKYLVAILECP